MSQIPDAPEGQGTPLVDLVVDQRGRRCPLPVIELARRITEVPVGGVVRVITDDPAATTDIPAWCRLCGHELMEAIPSAATEAWTTFRVRRLT